jgi:GrpB-like predicted nucleotidyltransferase (UPF0157 family)
MANMAETLEEKIRRVLREDVVISEYDPGWPEMFQREKEHLLKCLPPGLIRRIEHYGSTAVPGLAAKPIIDMLVEVTDLDETKARVAPVLEAQGYDYFWRPTWGDDVPPFYAWFIKRDSVSGTRTHHIHMITGSPEFAPHWDALGFRDYLIEQPEIASEYEQLKRRLAKMHPSDRMAYTSGKSEFVSRVMRQARQTKRG